MPALLPFPNPNSIPHSELPPRRTGKVARLPKATRNQINRMLDENVPYHAIIAQLGEAGKDLNPQNISNWAQGGYQDYLRHQDTLDLLKDQLEFATDLLAEVPDPSAIFQALRLMAGLQLNRFLLENGQKLLETDPAAYARLVQNICNLSRAELQYRKSRNTQAQAQSAPAKPIDYFRPLTERETHLIRAKLDEMCGYPAEPATVIKPDQASVVEVRFQRAGEGGSQPPVPAPAASSAIKPDQASGEITASDAPRAAFQGQSSTFEIQGSPAQAGLVPSQPALIQIKPNQAAAVAAAPLSAAGEGGFQPSVPAPLESSSIKVDQAAACQAGTNFTPPPTTSAIASPIKAVTDGGVHRHPGTPAGVTA